MSAWSCAPGNTLLVPSGPSGLHLFIITLGPIVLPGYGPKPQAVMVSATTIRDGIPHDSACELRAGEHPFIQHPSYIAYRYIRLDQTEHVESLVQSST